MATYIFRLHDGPMVTPILETVIAGDDEEAWDLAQLRLTLSKTFTHVDVQHAGREVFRLRRDSQSLVSRHVSRQ